MKLITGGTGLLGSHLLLHLLQEQKQVVRAIYRKEERISKTKNFFDLNLASDLFNLIEWVKADITDVPSLEVAFENITHVYHCAAFISFLPKDEKQMRKTNIEGTANMINLSIDNRIQKFCHVSSIAALGETLTTDQPITELTNWNPELYHNDYSITKYGGEMEVWRGTQEGLNVVIVNPGIIFGNGFKNEGSDEFFQKIEKGFPFYTKGRVGIVSAKDTVKAMVLLMNSDIVNEKFTIVSDNVTYRELFDYIAELVHKKKPSLYIAPSILTIAWKLDAFISYITPKKRSFTRSIAQASSSQYLYDNAKIQSQLSFTFIPYQTYLKDNI